MKKRKFFYIYILLFFSVCCAGPSSKKDPDSLYVHLGAEPGTLNPITSTEAIASAINNNIYETLVDRDYDTLKIIPQLAEKWEISDDKMKYIFHLKKGVLWSDGVPFTADDIVYSFRVIKDAKTACAPLKVYYFDIKDVKKIDSHTVEFVYSKPYYLALEICGELPIVPKHIFDDGTDFNTHKNNRFPVGTGPYKFSKWSTGKNLVLTINEKYRGKKPEIKTILYKIVHEDNVALQMLKKGDLDVMGLRPIQWVRQTDSDKFKKSFYKFKYYLPNYSYIGWNARRDFFADRKVRVALTHLIDRESILNKLQFGLGEIVTGDSYIFSSGYNKNIRRWPYDPEKGKLLLKEAGWSDSNGDGILDKNGEKFSFTFTIPSSSKFAERLTSILKEDFSRAGVEMNINRYEWAVFVQKLHTHDFDAVTLSWSLGYGGDPYQLWHSSQTEKGSNFCYFINKEADELIEKNRVEFVEKRRDIYHHRLHEILHHEQPYTFMFCNPSLVVVSKRFNNVKAHLRGLNYLEWKVKPVL